MVDRSARRTERIDRDECISASEFTVAIDGSGFSWATGCVSAPAGSTLTIRLINNDSSGHNISIYPQGSSEPVFEGPVCLGPDHITYEVPPLAPGTYRLVDAVGNAPNELVLVVE